jgi:hypothetical protein
MNNISNAQFRSAVWKALSHANDVSRRVMAGALVSTLLPLIDEHDIMTLIEKDPVIAEVLGGGEIEELRALLRPTELTCPSCGSTPEHWRYLEDIQNFREVLKVAQPGEVLAYRTGPLEKQTLVIAARYETGEGYDDGIKHYFECHAPEKDNPAAPCLHSWPVPSDLEIEFD